MQVFGCNSTQFTIVQLKKSQTNMDQISQAAAAQAIQRVVVQ